MSLKGFDSSLEDVQVSVVFYSGASVQTLCAPATIRNKLCHPPWLALYGPAFHAGICGGIPTSLNVERVKDSSPAVTRPRERPYLLKTDVHELVGSFSASCPGLPRPCRTLRPRPCLPMRAPLYPCFHL